MNKIQIDGELDRTWIITLMSEGLDTYQILRNYDVTEQTIMDSADLLDKDVLLQGFDFSEDFIRKSIEIDYFTSEDLYSLSMKTYSKLSDDFIQEYKETLNWQKIIIYLTTQTDSFSKYLDIIRENNLWSLISANDLPIEFIRQNKNDLDWQLLSLVKCFTEEEKEEFGNYIVITKGELTDEQSESFKGFSIVPDFEKTYSVDEIADLIDKYMSENNNDFYINIEK